VRVFLCLTHTKEHELDDLDNPALPTGDTTAAAGGTANNGAEHDNTQGNPGEGEGAAGGEGKDPAAEVKKEKTPEQREIDRLRRRVDTKTRQLYEARAQSQAPQQRQQQQPPEAGDGDDEPITLTRAELRQQIEAQARQLAPSMKEQHAQVERRQDVVTTLAKEWGQEKFDTISSDLDDAFGGLVDRSGAPKPATDAIFEADDPKAVIEFLSDPDNAAEAERISKMTAVQAGRAIAKLEVTLATEKSKAKPQPSKAAAPLEPPRGAGVPNGMPDPSNTKAYMAWANAQERAQR
jgi:hypothetical protein